MENSTRPTGISIREAFATLTKGVEMECIQNDRTPYRAGMRVKIVKPGRTAIQVEVTREPFEQMPGRSKPILPGATFWMQPPTKVADFDHASELGLTYRLDGVDTVKWAVLS